MKFPSKIKEGSAVVMLHRFSQVKGEKEYTTYRLDYYEGGKRCRPSFASLEDAQREGREIARRIDQGLNHQISSPEVAAFKRACELLGDTPIELACAEYAQATKRLAGISLEKCVDFWCHHHGDRIESRTVTQAVEEYIASRAKAGRSPEYIRNLKFHLRPFAQNFQVGVVDLTGRVIASWIQERNGGARCRNNHRGVLLAFTEWCKVHHYLPRDWSEMEAVAVETEPRNDIEIFSPDELKQILTTVFEKEPNFLPFILVGAFTGMRSSEIATLDWSELDLETGRVVANQIKGGRRRRPIPLQPNLVEWLRVLRPESGQGLVCPWRNIGNKINRLKVPWKRNALRHSYISYRVEFTHDIDRVAIEAGNSPAMIFKHYREIVTPAAAKEWFSITPGTVVRIRSDKTTNSV